MRLNETQINAVRTAIADRQAEITSVIGKAKALVRCLEDANNGLSAVMEKVEFVYDNDLDVSEDKAREAVVYVNSVLDNICGDIDTDDIESFLIDGGTDVITRLMALGD